ncbi:suppressor of los1-1 [Mycoemilia scoparia]|uniref:6-phosphogluconolactonase n=1 Tax=Mycoemilia scoparia TaxID=417184 RepID=A0A9W8A726_9FUNG|nr:suppressor of los1-1 [Mycoemilia scoparia]
MEAKPTVVVVPAKLDLEKEICTFLVQLSKKVLSTKERFNVAFSGGSLPSIVASFLADREDVEFSKWHVYFADERCCPLDHPDSNYLLVKAELLDRVKIPSSNVHAINPELVNDPEKAAADYQSVIEKELPLNDQGIPVFDCILLGIGPDGHTCSLFPNYPQVQETKKFVTHILDSPKPPPSRITLTLPVLNSASSVVFVISGSGKTETIDQIFHKPEEKKPASFVNPGPGKLFWLVDKSASAHIDYLAKPVSQYW